MALPYLLVIHKLFCNFAILQNKSDIHCSNITLKNQQINISKDVPQLNIEMAFLTCSEDSRLIS